MNSDILKGNWKQFKGDIKQKWGKLTDDQITQADGNRKKLLGLIQENYGVALDDAEKQIKEFEKSLAA